MMMRIMQGATCHIMRASKRQLMTICDTNFASGAIPDDAQARSFIELNASDTSHGSSMRRV
eukprot:11079963-Prorocentrum_lima.AAC.1